MCSRRLDAMHEIYCGIRGHALVQAHETILLENGRESNSDVGVDVSLDALLQDLLPTHTHTHTRQQQKFKNQQMTRCIAMKQGTLDMFR